MSRITLGAAMAALLFAAPLSAAHAASDNQKIIENMKSELKQDCFSTHTNDAPAVKAKCECFANSFVDSLTPGEIAVPKRSPAIGAKLAAARHACHFGDI